jgi:hypothetical protein
VGDERWRRRARSPLAVATAAGIGLLLLVQAVGPRPVAIRVAGVAVGLVCAAVAVDAWRGVIVVGTDGVWARRALVRLRLSWADIAGFDVKPSGLAGYRVVVRAVPHDGRPRPLHDYPLPYAEGQQLAADLASELERHR